MTQQFRPSDGRTSQRPHLKLNAGRYKPGDRVVYDGFGGWQIGTIERLVGDGNTARIGVAHVSVTNIKGHVPEGADEAALLAGLHDAAAEYGRVSMKALHDLASQRAQVLARHGVS